MQTNLPYCPNRLRRHNIAQAHVQQRIECGERLKRIAPYRHWRCARMILLTLKHYFHVSNADNIADNADDI